ncbi:hypothetical protein L1987_24274 [Smallanthus sonchifolius]|uniref:Uncharacterized protein n=1 Tax=Smallanthus sonchifolius TaxID=185202 RepID=A0ACB9ILR1_9ASTR|nr:hypothetical protein L1987_24274 [Smallanthus sonchifolius]
MEGIMKSALARKGKSKAASLSTARAKKLRQQPETEQIPKPNWRNSEALCDQHEVWQEELYYEKMANGLSSPDNALQVEKAVKLSEFRPLGVYKCFKRLGWEEALSFRDEEGKNKIPREAIYQWMATLKKELGSNPPRTTTLTGKVGNKSGHNIIPRTSDKGMVCVYELRLLAALVTGSEMLSLRQLVMSNVWGSQNSKDMCAIPHCRLITALMRTQRVLDEDSQYTFKVHRFFSVKGVHDMENWKYTLTERKHIMKDRKTGQVLFGMREDVPSLAEDFMEEEEEEDDTEESESEDETETEKATRRLKKSIHEHVVANRSTEYAGWDRPFQMLWDQNARSNEINNRRMTKLEEDQERHALAVQWAIQEEVNDRYRDAEVRRRFDDWVHGRVFRENPAPIPCEQVQPYQGGHIPFSYPKTHASRWVPLQVPRYLRSPAEVGHLMHLIFMAHCRIFC